MCLNSFGLSVHWWIGYDQEDEKFWIRKFDVHVLHFALLIYVQVLRMAQKLYFCFCDGQGKGFIQLLHGDAHVLTEH